MRLKAEKHSDLYGTVTALHIIFTRDDELIFIHQENNLGGSQFSSNDILEEKGFFF